jgi:superfamily I DNA/RNA helicase
MQINGLRLGSDAKSAGAVTIMSIHKSKGLEFPYVIIADCSKRINKSDATEDMIISPSTGVGMVILNNDKLQKYQATYPNQGSEKYMSIALLDFAVKVLQIEHSNETEPYSKSIKLLTAEIEETLGKNK